MFQTSRPSRSPELPWQKGVAVFVTHRVSCIDNIIDLPRPHEDYTTPGLEEARHVVDTAHDRILGPLPIAITKMEEQKSNEVIRLADKMSRPTLPSSPWEKYEYLMQDLAMGVPLSDAELAWMKRYEMYLETGRMAGDGGLYKKAAGAGTPALKHPHILNERLPHETRDGNDNERAVFSGRRA